MSVIGNLRVVTAEQLAALRAQPELVVPLLYPEESPNGGALPEGPDDELYLDKSWHGIHFLLTGTAWGGSPPLNFLAGELEEIGDVDVGSGPARALQPESVQELARALDALTEETLRRRFDPEAMVREDIYPSIWHRDPAEDDALGYLLAYFDELRAFVRDAGGRGLGLLVYLN
jgi:hypothetical protein